MSLELITLRDKVLQALKDAELDILKELDRICRKHDIKYSLGGGTCLGQYRHGGIIPWDDDVDVDMVGENYDRFIQIAQKELDPQRFFLRCRQTTPGHLRTSCRIELKNTRISIPAWDKAGLECGVFLDIFRWSYLPNDEAERKKVASRLYFLRCAQSHLMFGTFAKKLDPSLYGELKKYCKNTPIEEIYAEEDRLTHICGDEKTNWIIDDAIINGDHGGYPADGIDEYEDVEFEGLTVMNKKNSKNFLATIYGPRFYEWLKPRARISHHQWTKLDLGEYAQKYNLPADYADCMTLAYTPDKLEWLQKLTLDMYAAVDEICTRHSLQYYVMEQDAFSCLKKLPGTDTIWKNPGVIAMPKDAYDAFAAVCQQELAEKYLFQSSETDPEYKSSHARIRLKTTHVREAGIPPRMQNPETDGFFIRIVPLIPSASDMGSSLLHYIQFRDIRNKMAFKWANSDDNALNRASAPKKKLILASRNYSYESLFEELKKLQQSYPAQECKWYADGSGGYLKERIVPAAALGKGQRREFCGKNLVFPAKARRYCMSFLPVIIKKKAPMFRWMYCMYFLTPFRPLYRKALDAFRPRCCRHAASVLPQTHLNYFDIPDYQLSVWRYDETSEQYLSVRDILGFE